MNLSFITKFKSGKSTLFVERILGGLDQEAVKAFYKEKFDTDINNKHDVIALFNQYDYKFNYEEFDRVRGSYTPAKIHTIRKSDRWEIGKQIHPNINVRTPNQMQFAPILTCQLVSDFDNVITNGFAQNDGFDSIEDLQTWLSESKETPDKVIVWSKK